MMDSSIDSSRFHRYACGIINLITDLLLLRAVNVTIGELLEEHASKTTWVDMAEELGVTTQALWQWRTGRRKMSFDYAEPMASMMGVHVDVVSKAIAAQGVRDAVAPKRRGTRVASDVEARLASVEVEVSKIPAMEAELAEFRDVRARLERVLDKLEPAVARPLGRKKTVPAGR
jgi:hypothetical protein